jgi:hypothetical protein
MPSIQSPVGPRGSHGAKPGRSPPPRRGGTLHVTALPSLHRDVELEPWPGTRSGRTMLCAEHLVAAPADDDLALGAARP